MAQKPGPNRSQELQEISQSIDLTMETLRSVKETLIKALGDTPACPTCNQTLPYTPLEWGDCPSPPPTDTAWGDQIDIKQKKKKNPKKKNDFRCYRCGESSHSAKDCRTDFAEIQQKRIEKKQTQDGDVTD